MTLKDIRDSVDSLSRYSWHILILFLWYFLLNACTESLLIPSEIFKISIDWFSRLLVMPFLLAGVLVTIDNYQRGGKAGGRGFFFRNACRYYLYFLGVVVLVFIFALILMAISQLIRQHPALVEGKKLYYISIPLLAIKLFWLAAVIIERGRIVRSFFRSLCALAFRPLALIVGFVWGAVSFTDAIIGDLIAKETIIMFSGVRAGVLAFVTVLAYSCALDIYRKARLEIFGECAEVVPTYDIPLPVSPGEKCAHTGFTLAFLSFLPPFGIAALILGIIALRRSTKLVTKALVACFLGGFFSMVYLLVVAGLFFPRSTPVSPGYGFLGEADSRLKPYAALFEKRAFLEAWEQLKRDQIKGSERTWAFYCASAILKDQWGDKEGALADFRSGLSGKPDRGEFYYYYGKALLGKGVVEEAVDNFQLALKYKPEIYDAGRFLRLARKAYVPPQIVISSVFVVILLILFTFHEYAHALAASKLGDDTAKNQGRLSFNPIVHLDLIGSLILPAILLWRQSSVIFGWAKPVPVNPGNFADPRKDHMTVSFAGPAMNLLISMVCFLLLEFFLLSARILSPEAFGLNLAAPFSSVSLVGTPVDTLLILIITFLKQLFYTSLVLGCFNLLPIPPLDGSWILSGLLPERAGILFEKLRPYSFIIFLLIVFSPVLDIFLAIPVSLAWGLLHLCVMAMGFA